MTAIPQVEFKGNWSFSLLMNYESCPMRVKLKRIDRLPEKPQPPDSPLERGNREHDLYEKYVKGEIATLETSKARSISEFKDAFETARELFQLGMATSEDDWILDRNWGFCERDTAWLWMKLDLSVCDEESSTVYTIDYKTGRSQYKAIEHVQQTQLYAAVSALKFPWANTHVAELWYVDEGHIKSSTYTKEQALKFVGRFQQRADRIYEDRYFRANPNKQTCRYCPYGPQNGTGACPVGV